MKIELAACEKFGLANLIYKCGHTVLVQPGENTDRNHEVAKATKRECVECAARKSNLIGSREDILLAYNLRTQYLWEFERLYAIFEAHFENPRVSSAKIDFAQSALCELHEYYTYAKEAESWVSSRIRTPGRFLYDYIEVRRCDKYPRKGDNPAHSIIWDYIVIPDEETPQIPLIHLIEPR